MSMKLNALCKTAYLDCWHHYIFAGWGGEVVCYGVYSILDRPTSLKRAFPNFIDKILGKIIPMQNQSVLNDHVSGKTTFVIHLM